MDFYPSRIIVLDEDTMQWESVSIETFASFDAALDFANAETGVPWIIVNNHGAVVAAGDARGEYAD